jgi:hypothetical protein
MIRTTSRYRGIVTTPSGNVRLDLAIGDVVDDLEVEAIVMADSPASFEAIAPDATTDARHAAVLADQYFTEIVRTYPLKPSHPDGSDRAPEQEETMHSGDPEFRAVR